MNMMLLCAHLLWSPYCSSTDPEPIALGDGVDFRFSGPGYYGRAAYFTATTSYVDSGCVGSQGELGWHVGGRCAAR
jgi:hypothetical protein